MNKKASSPIVASIILIAVTVAVSIAVAALTGALIVGENSPINDVYFEYPLPNEKNATHISYRIDRDSIFGFAIKSRSGDYIKLPYTIIGTELNGTTLHISITYYKITFQGNLSQQSVVDYKQIDVRVIGNEES